MDIRELVEHIVSVAMAHDSLPDVAVAEITALAASIDTLQGREELLLTLLGQLHDYDPYAGVGCFGSGATLAEIRTTIESLQSGSCKN